VKFYKLFKSHRPAEMNLPDAPFFLAVRHGERKQNNNVWYMKAPLGKNEVGKFFSKAAEKAGIQVPGSKISNHSVRKTCTGFISRLLDGNTPEKFVAQLSGHQNIVSLQSYKSASEQHQRRMSRVLSRQSSSLRMESSQVFARSASQPLCSPPAKQQDETLLQISEATKTAQTYQPVLRQNILVSHSTTAASTSSQMVFDGANIQDAIFSFFMAPPLSFKRVSRRSVEWSLKMVTLNSFPHTATHSILATKRYVDQIM